MNSLLNQDRVIVDDTAGTTRDSISVDWIYQGRKIQLIDTAGIEKKVKLKNDVEKKCHDETLRAVKFSHVIICMIDALRAF